MASVDVTDDFIEIQLTGWERFCVGRERVSIPNTAIRYATEVAEPLRLARGARRGIAVSGFLKIGVWGLFGGPRQLVVARRGEPGLRLVLDRSAAGGDFDEVLLSGPAAAGIVDVVTRTPKART